MMIQNERNCVQSHLCRVMIALVVAILSALLSQTAVAQSNPIPPEVKKIEMGASTAAVTKQIQAIGTHSTEPVPKQKNRTRLVWVIPNSPLYQNVAFEFTEKDRLYLIRFTLNDAARSEYPTLKREVFKDYGFSWERPYKLRIPDKDVLTYGPEKGMTLFFFEFTNRKTHEKAFELFDRSISSTDRAHVQPKEAKEGLKQPPEGEASTPPATKPTADQAQEGQKPETSMKTGSDQKPPTASTLETPQEPKPEPGR
jgi:hypothetical protein